VPGNRDSAGAQFFICVTPQPSLDGQYTVFARVVEGIGVVTLISEASVDGAGKATERIEMTSVTIRDAPRPASFPSRWNPRRTWPSTERCSKRASAASPSSSCRQGSQPRAELPAARFAGVYDRTAFHRVVPGFMIQTGYLGSKQMVMDEAQQALVGTLQPEFNDTPHDKGIVSMARGEDPASASTSFFIVTARVASLDGTYTAFGRVVDGMSVVEAIEQVPKGREAPERAWIFCASGGQAIGERGMG